MTFDQAISDHAQEVAGLVISKQKDYGKDNILKSVVDPKVAIAVRLQDKVARLANLSQTMNAAKNESLMDTAKDIAGYGLILMMVLDDTFKLPMEGDDE